MYATQQSLLPNAADKAVLKRIAYTVVHNCPGLQDAAHEAARDLLEAKGLSSLDPDEVYFHRFKTAQSSTRSFTGWEHIREKPYESMTLTQLVIHRFRATDQDNADLLDLYGGFYSEGPQGENFDEKKPGVPARQRGLEGVLEPRFQWALQRYADGLLEQPRRGFPHLGQVQFPQPCSAGAGPWATHPQ